MKILLVTPFLPHRNAVHAGGRFLHWLVEELAREADLFLLTRVSPDEAGREGDAAARCKDMRTLPHSVRSGEPGKAAERAASYARLGLRANGWMRERRFDLVQVEYVEAGACVRPPDGLPSIIDCHDVVTKPRERRFRAARGAAALPAALAYLGARLAEKRILRKFSMAFVRSEVDRSYLAALGSRVPVRIVAHPCGLDLSGKPRSHDGRTILFLGALHRAANVDAVLYFARNVFPRIREQVPDARFVVAGANPPDAVSALAAAPDGGIRVAGRVAEVESSYLAATVFAAPILVGGGIIVKILDAMAAGVPVVTTGYGNEGILAAPGDEILVADDPAGFSAAVVRLLRDDALNARLGRNGKAFVDGRFGRDAVARAISGFHRELLEGSAAPRPAAGSGGTDR